MSLRRKRLVALAAVLLLLELGFAMWIHRGGRAQPPRYADCVVVPGTRSLADGTPGKALTARLNRAISLYREGWVQGLVCTGGRGESGTIEGEVERDYALKAGVPSSVIELERSSHNTRENFYFARELMRKRGWRTCLVATDPFHMRRCVQLAHDWGLEAYPAPTFEGPSSRSAASSVYYTLRETGSWFKYAHERWLWPPALPSSESGS